MKFKNQSATTVDGAKPGESIDLDPKTDGDHARSLVKRGVISWDEYLPAFVERKSKKAPVKKAAKTKGEKA